MLRLLLTLLSLTLLPSCLTGPGIFKEKERILSESNQGNFTTAQTLIAQALLQKDLSKADSLWLIIHQSKIERIRLDFSKSEQNIRSQLSKYFLTLTDSLMNLWEETGHLEMRIIDGEKKYFKYAVANLFRLDSSARAVRSRMNGSDIPDPIDSICLDNTQEILLSSVPGQAASTVKITFDFTITLGPNVVPEGQRIRCWLPFPAECPPRQGQVKLLSSSPGNMTQGSPSGKHSSLYAESTAVKNEPTVFTYRASFETSGQWFDPISLSHENQTIVPDSLKKYLIEEPPHIVFTSSVKKVADSLVDPGKPTFDHIRSFYYWIDKSIPWASALEYSTFDCIPDYVLNYRHGDCGMVTFLLMSMARYKGIPARWQSGWMLHPGSENLHDWCELWFPNVGWVPVDMSFGLQQSDNPAIKDFYLTGIDSYRLIINNGTAGELDPQKIHYRSEPFDFQRGELETPEANIYFNQWDYNLNVLSIQKIDR